MGIFSKIFGSNKLELQDDSNNNFDEKKQKKDEDSDGNKTISPFLRENKEVKKD